MNDNSIPGVNESFCLPHFPEIFHKLKSEQQTFISQNLSTIKLV